jgi:hypothetical protein
MTAVATKVSSLRRRLSAPLERCPTEGNPVPEPLPIKFEVLLVAALGEWPESLALPVRPAANGGIIVEGLIDLEHDISRPWIGHEREVLMSNLHWAICAAVATRARSGEGGDIVPGALNPADIRRKFEADLRSILEKAHNWEPQDLRLIERYFAER